MKPKPFTFYLGLFGIPIISGTIGYLLDENNLLYPPQAWILGYLSGMIGFGLIRNK